MAIEKKLITPLYLVLFAIAASAFLYIFGGEETTSPFPLRKQSLFEELNIPPIEHNSQNIKTSQSQTTPQATTLEFHGYACTNDCSGHEAGYKWAEENHTTNISECEGNSQSFNEGCQAYLEENGYY